MAAKPLHEIRRGLVVVRIYRRRSRSTSSFSLSTLRLYRNGKDWKESRRFGHDDVPLLRLALDEAYRWIFDNKETGR
ncbi:hypothetical protein [Novipirellula artificiosorum]|uniref:Uncharacterized protein n=1 Tax=Novipirellula artificiosorum TaxID=2528016 RepID=A0A5C6DGD2_9BACT|nr:hypothetical protein [Novipirellula artificiosorum]TWU34877.1 hypothetical protein Poly41_40200 [Novipirellula artificiosorum]